MELTKILYKIVENPKDLKNYIHLKQFFSATSPHFEEAIAYLLEVKNVADNNNSPKQSENLE
jgi:hypothetical protein